MPKVRHRVVIDNGGFTCKVGLAGQADPVRQMHNGLTKSKSEHKVFIGDQLESCQDFSALQYRRSLERGCLVNWDTQAEVWARAFGSEVLGISPADSSLLLSEAPMTPTSIQDTLDEMIFEHFGFASYCTRPAPALAACAIAHEQQQQDKAAAANADGAAPPAEEPAARPCTLVVDAGFSATHCVPIFDATPVNAGIKRLNVGGKLLTNHMKQVRRPPTPTPHPPPSPPRRAARGRSPAPPHASPRISAPPRFPRRSSRSARST